MRKVLPVLCDGESCPWIRDFVIFLPDFLASLHMCFPAFPATHPSEHRVKQGFSRTLTTRMSSRRLCPQNPSSEERQDTDPEGSLGISTLAPPIAALECPKKSLAHSLFQVFKRRGEVTLGLSQPLETRIGELPWFTRQKNSHLPLSPPCSPSCSFQSGDGNRCCSVFPPTSPSPPLLKRESPGAPPWHLRNSAFPHLSHELVTR